MRIYIIDAGDYLELGETPSFDYESNLFKFSDFTMSRTVDMTLPRSPRNDRILSHPSQVAQESTVIDGKLDAVLCGGGVQVRGTLYISEVTADGYESTFIYGDIDGLQALDEKIGDVFDPSVSVTLESGQASDLKALDPAELNPMVCMDYSVNLEASQDEYGTGFSSADMNCVMYSSTRGLFIALGDCEGWTSENGVTWEKMDSAVIKRFTWYALEEDSSGNLVAVGAGGGGLMEVATALPSGLSFTLAYTSPTISTHKKRAAAYQNGSYVAATNGNRIAIFNSGTWERDVTGPTTGMLVHWLGGSGNMLLVLTSEFAIGAVSYAGLTVNMATGTVTYRNSTYMGTYAGAVNALNSSLRSSNPNHSFYYHDNTSLNTTDTECVYETGAGLDISDLDYDRNVAWTKILDESMYAMTYGGGYYVGAGAEGGTWQGTSYTALSSGGSCGEQSLNGVAYNDSTWVAVGNVGAFFYSTDHGVTWTAATAVVSVITTGFAPMPCVNLMWLTYQGIISRGLTPVFSDSAKALAPYLYIMLSQCVDQYGLEVSEGAECYLRYNMPDMTVLELLELCCSLTGELPYIDGNYLRFFGYDYSGSVPGSYDVCERSSVLHAVTDNGAQANNIVLSVPDSDEDEMPDDAGTIWSYATPNATLDESQELYSSDVSTGASNGGILQVTNVSIDADEDDDGNTTYEIEREGDLTLCWYDGGNGRMMYVGGQTLTTRMKWAGLSEPSGVRRLESIYANALTYTATLEMSLPRFMEITFDDLIAFDGAAFCVANASWSEGTCETTLVKIPRENVAAIESQSFKITTAVSPSGSGTVTGGGTYKYGTQVTLTATASAHYVFKGWNDGAATSTRTVTVTGRATYTAYFELATYTVTVASSPEDGGTVSGGGTYKYGAEATLEAVPAVGHKFGRWSNGDTSEETSVTVTGDADYIAYFALETYTITVKSDPSDGGTVTGGGTYEYGTEITLTATPATGCTFDGWSDGVTTATRTITVTGKATYTAYFGSASYLITAVASPSYGGSVDGGGWNDYGTDITLSATPAEHYELVQWSNGETARSITVTVTGDATYIAYFDLEKFTVSAVANPSAGGTVIGGGTYQYGTEVTLTAMAADHYVFRTWTNDGVTASTRTITVTEDITYTAYFELAHYTIDVGSYPSGCGTVTGGGIYEYGTEVTLTATPAEHYIALLWSDGSTSNPRTVTVTGDATYTVYFELATHTLTAVANPSAGGTVIGGGTYQYGTEVTLTAMAADHYVFRTWTNDGVTASTRTITVTEDITYTAYFELAHYTIDVGSYPSGCGTVTGGGIYEYGTEVTLTATPAEHYIALLWSDGSTSNPRTVTVTGDATYTVYFELVTYTITAVANPSAGGTVIGGGTYQYGTEVTLEAVPSDGYYLDMWDDGSTSRTRTITVTEDTEVTAYFDTYSYTITATAFPSAGGTATGGGIYEYGETAYLEATAATGYEFNGWSTGEASTETTVKVAGDASYVAFFEKRECTITTSADPSGGGTVSGGGTYNYGASVTLTATAATGYEFDGWTYGEDENPSITITVTGDLTITAYFKLARYTITATADPLDGGTVDGGGTYQYGTEVTLTAVAATGYNFLRWSTDDTLSEITVKVTGDATYTAYFGDSLLCKITTGVSPSGGGTVTGGGTYNYGDTATLTAMPADGYTFIRWDDNSTSPFRTVLVTGSKAYTAYFGKT